MWWGAVGCVVGCVRVAFAAARRLLLPARVMLLVASNELAHATSESSDKVLAQ